MRSLLSLAAAVALLACAAVTVRADEPADAKALLDKALKAAGGADNLAKVKAVNVQMKGKFYGMGDGVDYTATVAWQAPDKQRVEVEGEAGGQQFKFTQIVNKDKGWSAVNDNVTKMDKEQLAEVKETLHAEAVVRLTPAVLKTAKLESLGEGKVNDKPALGVRIEVKGYRDVALYFDKETHLLIKSERRAKDAMNGGDEFNNETFYHDYKKIDGVQVPRKVTINHDGKKFVESEVTEYKPVDKIDDAQFAKP